MTYTKAVAVGLLSIYLLSILMPSYFSMDAFGELATGANHIKVKVTSPDTIHGIAGQIITINGTITNFGSGTIGGIAYISIVDLKNKIPIDLEDWSAQKGREIPSIGPGQSIQTDWNVRLVKDGSYTVVILFSTTGNISPPTSSSKVHLDVAPKHSLNPGNVLPVAFGVPAVLMGVLGAINYTRGRKMGVYR